MSSSDVSRFPNAGVEVMSLERIREVQRAFVHTIANARMAGADGSSLALGTVSGDFAPRDGGLAGRIVGDGGDTSIDGEMSLGTRGIALDARLAPRPGAGDGVARVLAALGQPDANGAVRLQWLSANR